MSLNVKDSSGSVQALKTTLDSGQHVQSVNVDTSALPSGAATSANQTTQITALNLAATAAKQDALKAVADLQATAALQTTGNSSLSSILTAVQAQASKLEAQPTRSTAQAAVVRGKTADITGTTATSVIAAPGASFYTCVVGVALFNSHATVGTWVNLLDDTTAIFTVYLAPAGGRAELMFPPGTPLILTANKAFQVQCETNGSNVRASAVGYTLAV